MAQSIPTTSFDVLGTEGPFAKNVDWFTVRQCQRQMAESVEDAINTQQVALLESGTGTGKTFAYLVPPLLHGKKTIISTRTKYLQEQIFHKDIPVVCKALNIQPAVSMLKGRGNYLCLKRHDHANKNPDLLGFTRKFNEVYNQVMERDDGDISGYNLRSDERQRMTTTADMCIGANCEFSRPCFANRAKQAARQADVLVVNHNLLSLATKIGDTEMENSMLSGVDVVVVDEAHRFPDIAAQSLGISLSKERLDQFCSNLESVAQTGDLDINLIASITRTLTEAGDHLKKQIDTEQTELSLAKFEESESLVGGFWKIVAIVEDAISKLEPHIESSPEIQMCRDQLVDIVNDAKEIFERDSYDVATWCESTSRGFSLHRLPLEPGRHFGPVIADFPGSWIFTSATLAVGEDFTHFEHSMGLNDSITGRWDSPFDFEKQTLLFLPSGMPTPVPSSRQQFDQRVVEVIEQLVPLTQGRILALFTSAASMKAARAYLTDRIDYTLLCQYERSNAQLLEEFKRDGNAVLLGTMGFWEGVDIKGDALACVIIDKLPFGRFDTPQDIARRSLMEENGASYFNDWQVPNAVLTLKQGSGRLIRDVTDRGILVLCDPRITSKSYGRAFLSSLPPMPRASSLDRISQFFTA